MIYDVIIPTWNSARTLRQCLESIRSYARPSRIIVVDRHSTDSTREIAKSFDCTVLEDSISLGSARIRGVEKSKSPWIAFIDSDIALRAGWHDDMMSYVGRATGAVQGRTILTSSPIREMRIHNAQKLFRNGIRYLHRGDRGFTNATIIRRNLLSGLDLAPFNAWEDYVITQGVLESGYQWKYVPVFVDHIESVADWLGKVAWGAKGRKQVLKALNVGTVEQMRITLSCLGWYLSQAVTYPLILGRPEILGIFLRGLGHELRGMIA